MALFKVTAATSIVELINIYVEADDFEGCLPKAKAAYEAHDNMFSDRVYGMIVSIEKLSREIVK